MPEQRHSKQYTFTSYYQPSP